MEIPYGLRILDLPLVVLACTYRHSSRSDSVESLRISAASGVNLSLGKVDGSMSETCNGKIAPEALVPLLKLFESQGFFEMEEDDAEDQRGAVRTMSLVLPGRKKQVVRTGMSSSGLDLLTGAMKFTAGLSVPEALGRNFLQHL